MEAFGNIRPHPAARTGTRQYPMTDEPVTDAPKPQQEPDEVKRISIDYIKSNFFRVVYVDGVFGGVTPSANIEIVFWNTRLPIPKTVVLAMSPDGTVKEESRILRADQIREAEVAVVMDLEHAKLFGKWLNNQVKQLETILSSVAEEASNVENTGS